MKHSSSFPLFAVFFAGIITGAYILECFIFLGFFGLYKFSQDQGNTIAAFATVAAIVVGWKIHNNQMQNEKKLHEEALIIQKNLHSEALSAQQIVQTEARERRTLSYRAQMNDAVVDLTQYCSDCFQYVREGLSGNLSPKPVEAIAVFKNSLEFVDTESSNAIFRMISFYQVHNSRYRPNESSPSYTRDRQYDSVILNALFLKMFDFARNADCVLTDAFLNEHDVASSLSSIMRQPNQPLHLPEWDSLHTTVMERFVRDIQFNRDAQ